MYARHLYEILVNHEVEKFGHETVQPTAQGATFSMRGQQHCGHSLSHYVMRWRDCVCNLDTICMHQETPAGDNEVRILECRALVQRTAGTPLGITRRLHVGKWI